MRLEMREQPLLRQEADTPIILIVDDEEIIRDLCARALKEYRVLQAQNGREALDILENQAVDIILTDVMMPVVNGLELLQSIKEHAPDQPVLVMTGFADKEIILKALKAHADDFIEKPINLLQMKASIEKALEQRNLRRELSQLRQIDRLKTEFLGLVSHKLRTPATSISLFIQNLASGAIDLLDPGFDDALHAAKEESDYLAYLIQDLLYYSDILLQDSPATTTREDLKEIAATVLTEKHQAAAKKDLALHSSFPGSWPAVNVDRRRIAFALTALLDNAIKFTPPGGQVTLSGEVTDEELILALRDNGPGIPLDEQPKVFEKFYQVDPNRTGQVRGFGLGLFYARQFIRDHGGTIRLTSTPGSGTEITVRLPRLPVGTTK